MRAKYNTSRPSRRYANAETGRGGSCTLAPPALTSIDALAAPDDLTQLTLAEAAARVRTRTVSPVELTDACLRRVEALNPQVNAYITVTRDLAMEQARELEAAQKRGQS